MQTVNIEKIKELAYRLAREKKKWHFHLLTPGCFISLTNDYLLFLEDTEQNIQYGYASSEKPMEVAKGLFTLLHGEQMFDKTVIEKGEISGAVSQMMQRAAQVNQKGFFWHHHVLFPDCVFNKHKGNWTIMFEDPETKEILESVNATEPKRDIKEIEPAFYNQKVG